MNLPTIFPEPDCFKVVNALSSPDSFDNLRLLVLAVGWDQNGNRSPDGLLRRIAEGSLGSGIPGGDDTFEGLAYDCIVRGGDNRRQSELRLLGPLALGNVHMRADVFGN